MVAGLPCEARDWVISQSGDGLNTSWKRFGCETFNNNPGNSVEYIDALLMITRAGLLDLVRRMIDETSTRRLAKFTKAEEKRVKELTSES